jgi:hypothetical protein
MKKEKPLVDAIVGLDFGTGKTNVFLGIIVLHLGGFYPKAKIVVQENIAKWLDNCYSTSFHPYAIIKGEGKKYVDTIEALKIARKILKEKNRILLVAHIDHYKRAVEIAKFWGFKVFEDETYNRTFFDFSYDKNSKQWWTRNRIVYLIWDFVARIYFKVYVLVRKLFSDECPFRNECPYYLVENSTCNLGDWFFHCGYYKHLKKQNNGQRIKKTY